MGLPYCVCWCMTNCSDITTSAKFCTDWCCDVILWFSEVWFHSSCYSISVIHLAKVCTVWCCDLILYTVYLLLKDSVPQRYDFIIFVLYLFIWSQGASRGGGEWGLRSQTLNWASSLKLCCYCFDLTLLVLAVCVCVCGQTRVPLQQQLLHFNGKEIQNAEKLSAIGVRDGDLVMMLPTSERCSCCPS